MYCISRYCTSIEQIAVIEKLVTVFTDNGDVLNACLIKLEKVKVMFQMSGHHNETSSDIRLGLQTIPLYLRCRP